MLTIEKHELHISIVDLFEALDADGRKQVAKLIGADAEAWRQMAEALVDNHDIFNADEGWWLNPRSMIEVRQKLLPLMPEVARILAEGLQKQLDAAKAAEERSARWAWSMFHAHADIMAERAPPGSFPRIPDWAPAARDEMRVRDAAPKMLEALRPLGAWATKAEGDVVDVTLKDGAGVCVPLGLLRAARAALRAAEPPAESPETEGER